VGPQKYVFVANPHNHHIYIPLWRGGECGEKCVCAAGGEYHSWGKNQSKKEFAWYVLDGLNFIHSDTIILKRNEGNEAGAA